MCGRCRGFSQLQGGFRRHLIDSLCSALTCLAPKVDQLLAGPPDRCVWGEVDVWGCVAVRSRGSRGHIGVRETNLLHGEHGGDVRYAGNISDTAYLTQPATHWGRESDVQTSEHVSWDGQKLHGINKMQAVRRVCACKV